MYLIQGQISPRCSQKCFPMKAHSGILHAASSTVLKHLLSQLAIQMGLGQMQANEAIPRCQIGWHEQDGI